MESKERWFKRCIVMVLVLYMVISPFSNVTVGASGNVGKETVSSTEVPDVTGEEVGDEDEVVEKSELRGDEEKISTASPTALPTVEPTASPTVTPKVAPTVSARGGISSEECLILTYEVENCDLYLFEEIEATNYTIDWGDGCIDSNIGEHTYSKGGTYTLKLTFDGLTAIRFVGDYRLKSIDGKFNGCKNLMSLERCFYYCTGLESISSELFDNCTNVTSFSICFCDCESITEIPSGLFDNCPKVT